MGTCFKMKQNQQKGKNTKYLHTALSLAKRPEIPNWFEKKLLTPFLKENIFTVAAKLKVSHHICSRCTGSAACQREGLDSEWRAVLSHFIFSCHWFFFHFKIYTHLYQLFRRMLQYFFAVRLQKCFVDNKTSPDFTSVWWCLDIDWISFMGEFVL